MRVLASPLETQRLAREWKSQGKVALVPTMGCLHSGHLALVARAKELASRVIVSIFVNPLQFAPSEDFEKYPRPFEQDARQCEQAGVDLIFHPTPQDLYPSGFSTTVSVRGLTEKLCGVSRPGHFDGVATVCLKLFQISQADVAVFGEKDFQQLRMLQQMTTDLDLPLEIVAHPIVREADGLALSSRNRYLSTQERRWAARIPEAMEAARAASRRDGARVGDITRVAREILETAPLRVEYLELASENDLMPAAESREAKSIPRPRLFVAVKAGGTRLIDNVSLQ